MTIPAFNFEYTQNPYLKDALDEQLLAIDEAQKQYRHQSERALSQAKQTQADTNRTAAADYYNFINPYGAQTEALAYKGLKNSGISQSNITRGYSDYQNILGQAAKTYANAQDDINASILGYDSQADADKLSVRASYMSNLASDYAQSKTLEFEAWQDYQDRLYQQYRDQIDDDRYSREWAYKTI
jgi:hypothetical protein